MPRGVHTNQINDWKVQRVVTRHLLDRAGLKARRHRGDATPCVADAVLTHAA